MHPPTFGPFTKQPPFTNPLTAMEYLSELFTPDQIDAMYAAYQGVLDAYDSFVAYVQATYQNVVIEDLQM